MIYSYSRRCRARRCSCLIVCAVLCAGVADSEESTRTRDAPPALPWPEVETLHKISRQAAEGEGAALDAIGRDLSNGEPTRRLYALGAAISAYSAAKDESIRRVLVRDVVPLLGDEDQRVRETGAARMVAFFAPTDVDDESRDLACRLLEQAGSSRETILLVGLFGCQKMAGAIRARARGFSPDMPFSSLEWSAVCALARLGDQEMISTAIAEVTRRASGDATRALRSFRTVAYFRQPEAVAYLVQYLQGDAVVPGGDDYPPEVLAGHAAEALAGMLEGFPIVKRARQYSTSDIETCRAWVKDHRDTFQIRGRREWTEEEPLPVQGQ